MNDGDSQVLTIESEGVPDLAKKDEISVVTEGDMSKVFKDLDGLMYCRSKLQKKKQNYSAYFTNMISCIFVNAMAYVTNI